MRKRFTDSDLFAKSWFRKLSAQEKVLWFYVTQTCTFDAFWEEDKDAIEFYCNGYKGKIPEIIIEKLGMHKVDNEQWFLSNWIKFQYGELKHNVRPHKRIIERIIRKGLDEKFPDLIEGNGVYG